MHLYSRQIRAGQEARSRGQGQAHVTGLGGTAAAGLAPAGAVLGYSHQVGLGGIIVEYRGIVSHKTNHVCKSDVFYTLQIELQGVKQEDRQAGV